MSNKILVYNNNHYNHSTATLIQGLVKNIEKYDLEIYTTSPHNYAHVKGEHNFEVFSNGELQKVIEDVDVIVGVSDTIVPIKPPPDLLKERGVFLDSNDHAKYFEEPNNFKFYLKREMKLDVEHEDNVFPFWFAAEDRYYHGGKDFEEIWNKKDNSLACMMGIDKQKPWRFEISEILKWNFSDKGWVLDPVYGNNDDSALDTGDRNHSAFFDTLLRSRISVDAYGAGLANNTGRFFESIACGCCLFYQPITNHLPNPYIDGEDIVIYDNTAHLVEKINELVEDTDKLKSIAHSAFDKTLKYHSTDRRGMEFLELCKGYNLIS